MISTLTRLGLLALSLFGAEMAASQTMPRQAAEFIERTPIKLGCLVGGSFTADKEDINALVWPDGSGTWRAMVANVRTAAGSPPIPPCWSSPGRCALYTGSLPDLGGACSRTAPGLETPGINSLLYVANPALYGGSELRDVAHLLRLARGLEADDTMVMTLGDVDLYFNEAADGAVRARFATRGRTVRVARLRTDPATLDGAAIIAFADRLRSDALVAAGPAGAVTPTGLAIVNDVCFQTATPSEIAARLDAAEVAFAVSNLTAGAHINEIADEITHSALGADFSRGPRKALLIDQDPRIFLSRDGRASVCPG